MFSTDAHRWYWAWDVPCMLMDMKIPKMVVVMKVCRTRGFGSMLEEEIGRRERD